MNISQKHVSKQNIKVEVQYNTLESLFLNIIKYGEYRPYCFLSLRSYMGIYFMHGKYSSEYAIILNINKGIFYETVRMLSSAAHKNFAT